MHPYFRARGWEREGELYAWLGVRAIRPFVSGGRFWQRLGLASTRPTWNRRNVDGYLNQSAYAEVAHTASAGFLFVVAVLMLLDQGALEACVVIGLNLAINVLPIAALRYNRLRILRRIDRRRRSQVPASAET